MPRPRGRGGSLASCRNVRLGRTAQGCQLCLLFDCRMHSRLKSSKAVRRLNSRVCASRGSGTDAGGESEEGTVERLKNAENVGLDRKETKDWLRRTRNVENRRSAGTESPPVMRGARWTRDEYECYPLNWVERSIAISWEWMPITPRQEPSRASTSVFPRNAATRDGCARRDPLRLGS